MHNSRAILLQQCEPFRWEEQYNGDWLVHESVEVNEYLVKAKTRRAKQSEPSRHRRIGLYQIFFHV